MSLYSTASSIELSLSQCLPQCSISISKGLRGKKFPGHITQSPLSFNTSIMYLVLMESLKITLRTHWCCDYFYDSSG